MAKPQKMISKLPSLPSNYQPFLEDIKNRIRFAQLKAATSVNKEMIKLYWSIGEDLVEKQEKEGWGSKLIEKFGQDIQKNFPGIEGFSRTNIFRMRAFYLGYKIVPQAVGQLQELPIFHIPWGHNTIILEKIKNPVARLWYAQQTIENGWSRAMLETWIDSNLYECQGRAITNFKKTLPAPQSDLAHQTLKDPYNLDFLILIQEAKEKELEQSLVDHMQDFLVELGHGFAFLGRQYPLHIEGVNYWVDLIFYHTKLHCYVVVELKNTDFKPEYAGKMQFYVSAIDKQLKSKKDNPTIGLILCRKKKKLTVEYVLQDVNKPIGVAEIQTKIVRSLPKKLKGSLPTVKELEEELKTIKHESSDAAK